MRRLVAVGTAVVVLAMGSQASSFGTINGLGQNHEHEQITRTALKDAGFGPHTLSDLAGGRGTFGAVGAPDQPLRGLLSLKAAHCDGGDYLDVPGYPQSKSKAQKALESCRSFIFSHLTEAVNAAGGLLDKDGHVKPRDAAADGNCTFNGVKGRAKCNVLENLGLAFHASQDFYSHTNWMDDAAPGAIGPTNPRGLGNTDISYWLNPRYNQAFPAGLISGCYEGVPESRNCKYGDGKVRVRHEALNKDTASSPRGLINNNYAKAMAMAAADTKDKWAYFTKHLTDKYGDARARKMVCLITHDDYKTC